MVGRPLKFDPEIAIESAMQLFWSIGYYRSSLYKLIDIMGISKSSFYQAFESKQSLFESCLKRYQKMKMDDIGLKLEQADSGKEFIRSFFYSLIDQTLEGNERRGCLAMNVANEFGQSDEKVAKLVSDIFEELASLLEKALQRAQNDGEISQDKDLTVLSIYLVSSLSGLQTMVKSGMDANSMQQIIDTTLTVLDS